MFVQHEHAVGREVEIAGSGDGSAITVSLPRAPRNAQTGQNTLPAGISVPQVAQACLSFVVTQRKARSNAEFETRGHHDPPTCRSGSSVAIPPTLIPRLDTSESWNCEKISAAAHLYEGEVSPMFRSWKLRLEQNCETLDPEILFNA